MNRSARHACFFLTAIAAIFGGPACLAEPGLHTGFRSPPDSAKPMVFWQWINGCVTKEGITSDLESYKRVGIGGVQQFQVGGSQAHLKDPTVDILSPKWKELMAFAINECARLGLTFGTHNCPGWSASGGPDVTEEDAMKKLAWTVTPVSGPVRFSGTLPAPKPHKDHRFYRDIEVLAVRAEGVTPLKEVRRLTGDMKPDGSITCEVPQGNWSLIRLGMVLTGHTNSTGPVSGQGLEVDKMDKEALKRFWSHYPTEVIQLAGKHAGRTFNRIELDSYEAGPQDWTAAMPAEFLKRCRYEVTPWLPVLAGFTIESKEMTDRFREDWTTVIHGLVRDNYFMALGDLVRATPGMQFLLEPYPTADANMFENAAVAPAGDLLMCEFWQKPAQWGWDSVKGVVSSANVLGKRVVLAEAFTGQPMYAWKSDPYDLKGSGDRAFAAGVNQLIFHASAHQPWPALKPGVTMGWWGTHFGTGQTWWEHGGPEWIGYLSRSQHLLQQGNLVSDIAVLVQKHAKLNLPSGYGADYVGEEDILKMRVENGRLVTPGAASYAMLLLPWKNQMSLELARKLRDLVSDGAVISTQKPKRASGLRSFPECDAELKEIADEIWGPQGEGIREHRFGKGRAIWGKPTEAVLKELGVQPDVILKPDSSLHWTHRRLETGDLYFVSNQSDRPVSEEIDFRAAAPEVEIWHADTGAVEVARDAIKNHGRTKMPLDLEPWGSRFVLFLGSATPGRAKAPDLTKAANITEISGPWQVAFPAGLGAPESATFENLVSWSERPESGVKHFSGTATYQKIISGEKMAGAAKLMLDLGTVKNIASISLNGKSLPAQWKPPFRFDITGLLKPGANDLRIRVTNLWPNRLIGDEQHPEEGEWGKKQIFTYAKNKPEVGRPLMKVPEWIVSQTPRPSANRVTFTSYDFFDADDPLIESGLIGPVRIETHGNP